jgi:hypothetical protein
MALHTHVEHTLHSVLSSSKRHASLQCTSQTPPTIPTREHQHLTGRIDPLPSATPGRIVKNFPTRAPAPISRMITSFIIREVGPGHAETVRQLS